MLDIKKCCLVVVDVQGKLARLMYGKQELFNNIQVLIKAANLLDIPILWCQQSPEALGPTEPEIAELLKGNEPINKASFSCCGVDEFNSKLEGLNKNQILMCGIEAHICIYQTAVELASKSLEVTVVADAVSSRTLENKTIALAKLRAEGVKVGCVEMVLFELLKTAEHPQFRQIAKLIK